MTPAAEARAQEIADNWPDLTPDQEARISLILWPDKTPDRPAATERRRSAA